MFRKLVANLPFNPGLIEQVSFYARRIRQEQFVRRIGMVFAALMLTVQSIAFISPPERSLAASSNHIINGLRTRDDILAAWDQPGSDVPAIYEIFGVTRADIVALPQMPNATIKSTDADYWSIGRNSLRGYSGVDEQFKNSQQALQYAGADTVTEADDRFIYQRELRAWDIRNPSNSYKAFEGTLKSTGERYWIILDCGNFTRIGKSNIPPPPEPEPEPEPPAPTPEPEPEPTPPPPPPTPELEIKKTIVDRPDHFNPGDVVTYNISFRNKTVNSLAENVVIEDAFDTSLFNIANHTSNDYSITDGVFRYDYGGLDYSTSFIVIPISATLKDQVESGSEVCNHATISSTNADSETSNETCIGILTPCPFDDTIADSNNPNCVEPKLVCTLTAFSINRSTREVQYRTTVTSTNPTNTTVKTYVYNYGDQIANSFSSDELTHETSHIYEPGEYTARAIVAYRTTGQEVDDDKTINCATEVDFESDQPLGKQKTVSNITQEVDGDQALETTVKAGDVLEYTIITSNTQDFDRLDIDISDYIGDVLDYADLDLAFLETQGGQFDQETNKVNWVDQTVLAGSILERRFRVRIKDPIPATNAPSSTGTSFDCKISNNYGNEITMNVDCPLVKGLETLPNTGAGSSMIITVVITTVVGYFYARSRLLTKELDIVKSDYVGAH